MAEVLVLSAIAAQGALTGAPLGWTALAAVLLALGWRIAWFRHGIASLALGGLGMLGGAAIDRAIGAVPACHGGGFGFATVGMIAACTAGCVLVCRLAGRPGGDLLFHGIVVATMLAGEEVGRAVATLGGWTAGHWTLVGGMGLGTALGALIAALIRPTPPGAGS